MQVMVLFTDIVINEWLFANSDISQKHCNLIETSAGLIAVLSVLMAYGRLYQSSQCWSECFF